jgi:hypothetical protein
LDLLAARNNRLGGLLGWSSCSANFKLANKNIYNKKIRIFLKKKIETK